MINWPRQRLMSQGTENSMPRLLWKDGLTSMTALTAKQRLGVMFTVTVLSLTENGYRTLSNGISSDDITKMSNVFQGLLCYRMWLTKKCYWKQNDKKSRNRARKSIIKLMRQLQCDWNRASGQ